MSALVAAPCLRFRVSGLPIPQGSKRIGRHGKRPVILDANDAELKPWRAAIAAAAEATLPPDWQPLVGPLAAHLVFALPRPPSHPKRRRTWPTARLDSDKLARAVLDSCTTAKVWRDDGQVIDLRARKDFVGQGPAAVLLLPGVLVDVWRIPTETPPTGLTLPITTPGENA